MTKLEEFIQLVKENPNLPVIPMVDSDVVADIDYSWWLADFGSSWVGEYTFYEDRYYDDRESFKEDYFDSNCDELCERFNYCPRMSKYTVEQGINTEEELVKNIENEEKLDRYLDEIADTYFKDAVLVRICVPSYIC